LILYGVVHLVQAIVEQGIGIVATTKLKQSLFTQI